MTTITYGLDGNNNTFSSSDLLTLAAGTLGAHDSTQFVLTAGTYVVTVFGTGFTYSGNHPVTGTMTSLTLVQPMAYYHSPDTWTGFSLSAATVWNAIASGNVTAFNTLFFNGSDTFDATHGGSPYLVYGGAGNDTFNYAANYSGFTNLDGGPGTDTLNLDGDYSHFRFSLGNITNVEVVHLAGGHSYQGAIGPTTPMTLDGSALGVGDVLDIDARSATGSLNVLGGAGDDRFISGAGNDTFNGGAGNNTICYADGTGVKVDLSITGPQAVGGGRGTDTLISIDNIVGSNGADTLTGNANDNVFEIGGGDDLVDGRGGNATVSFAGAGAPVTIDLRSSPFVSIERIIGSQFGGDVFIGGPSDDFFDGNVRYYANPGPTLYDTANYQYATGGMTFNMLPGSTPTTIVATGGGQGTDTLVRVDKLIGSNYDDTFNFTDNLFSVDGGGGSDTVSYQTATGPVTQSLAYLTSIENLTGSNYNDALFGDDGNNYIDGGAGNDNIYKYPGTGVSNGKGNDTFVGGAGVDTVSYATDDTNYTITYNPDHSVTVSNATTGTDTLWSIEKITFLNHTIVASTYRAARDFNNDGTTDVLLQSDAGQAAVYSMLGAVSSGGGSAGSNPGTAWHVKAAGDFNNDGKADILWQNADGAPALWFMNGASVVGGGLVSLNPGPAWQIVSSGDFDGDGIADILFQNIDGTPAIWLMAGGTFFYAGATFTNPGTTWRVIGSGDFNGDGKSDILWQNIDGTPAIWLMNGTSFVSGAALLNPGFSWNLKAAGDFNGDGKSDLLWQNTDGTAAIWLMNGTSFVSGGLAGSNPGSSWHAVGAGDFNGDGNADILWQNVDGTPAVWLMNGTTLLSGAALPNAGANWHVIAMGN